MGNDNIKVDVQGDVHGSVVDKSKNKKVCLNKKEKEKEKNYWWIKSIAIGFIVFGLVWFNINSWEWGLGFGSISFLLMLKNNPKRYYRRMATISFLVAGLHLSTFKGLLIVPENDFLHGFLSIGEHSIPWIAILFACLSFAFAVLDYFENKDN